MNSKIEKVERANFRIWGNDTPSRSSWYSIVDII